MVARYMQEMGEAMEMFDVNNVEDTVEKDPTANRATITQIVNVGRTHKVRKRERVGERERGERNCLRYGTPSAHTRTHTHAHTYTHTHLRVHF